MVGTCFDFSYSLVLQMEEKTHMHLNEGANQGPIGKDPFALAEDFESDEVKWSGNN